MDLSEPVLTVCSLKSRLSIKDSLHWQNDTSRQEAFKVHKDTETIFLRFRKNLASRPSHIELINYPLFSVYEYEITEYLNELSIFYEFTDYAVIIANLKSNGGTINMHVDKGPYFQKSHRIHIPIRTNDLSIFFIGNIELHMKENIAYEIGNTNHRHGVINKGECDRYHLIFDLFTT